MVELDDLLSNREHINSELQSVLDAQTDPWGIKVSAVEVKHVDLPQEMQRAMAKQAEAERERRAKVINAEGEFQSASKMVDARITSYNVCYTKLLRIWGKTSSPHRSCAPAPASVENPASAATSSIRTDSPDT